MIENDFLFLSSRPFRLKMNFQMVKSCTVNKIFNLIQYKILRLGYKEREAGLG